MIIMMKKLKGLIESLTVIYNNDHDNLLWTIQERHKVYDDRIYDSNLDNLCVDFCNNINCKFI